MSTIPSSCLFTRDALKDVGGFDQGLKSHIDHDIWMSLGCKGYYSDYVDEPLVRINSAMQQHMTTDVDFRIPATELYIEKWMPVLEEWIGSKRAQKYLSEFYIRIVSQQIASLLDKRAFRKTFKCLRAVFFEGYCLNAKFYFYLGRVLVFWLVKLTGLHYISRKIKNRFL